MEAALLESEAVGSGKERGQRWALASGPPPAWAALSGLAGQPILLFPFFSWIGPGLGFWESSSFFHFLVSNN
ncbi:hypothetical protein RchiOBHm_Chr1g0353071 [Rosa chinensis]|uniref:Uncharacterized protein n=1 Tax=Rosa chinensis TaxID=74649 RepID=A0A2P6SGS0_ROSCH|nr:hypothetical protein RchiOBHm_Chr1g0353071 [Rosa chinensis]